MSTKAGFLWTYSTATKIWANSNYTRMSRKTPTLYLYQTEESLNGAMEKRDNFANLIFT